MISRVTKSLIGAALAGAMALPAPVALAGDGARRATSYNGAPVIEAGGRRDGNWRHDGGGYDRGYGGGYYGGGYGGGHGHKNRHHDNDEWVAPLVIGGVVVGSLLLLNALNQRNDRYREAPVATPNYDYDYNRDRSRYDYYRYDGYTRY